MFCPSCRQPVAENAKFCPACGAALGGATAVAGAVTGVAYGGFWRRFWGLIVDRLLIACLVFPFGMAFGLSMLSLPERWSVEGFTPETMGTLFFGSLTMFWIRVLIEWLYAVLFQSSARQATPGQMLLGLRVTDLEGRRISFARATGRHFGTWVSTLIFGIGFLMCAFHARKQTLHDLLAATLVVRG